jgi:hypothetical protein
MRTKCSAKEKVVIVQRGRRPKTDVPAPSWSERVAPNSGYGWARDLPEGDM